MIIACPDCAAVQCLPAPRRRGHLACYRCGNVLERRTGRSLDGSLACAIATLLLWFPANLLPLASVRSSYGFSGMTYLGSGCVAIWEQGWPLVAIVLGLPSILLPFIRFGVLVTVLTALRFRHHPRWLGRAFRYAQHLDLWAMPDVLLLGGIIGYGRVSVFIPVHVLPGGWCIIAAAGLAVMTRATLDPRAVWRRIEIEPADPAMEHVPENGIACVSCEAVMPGDRQYCPRCGVRVYRRKPRSLVRTNALLLTAFVLMPVAYYFPASTLWELGAKYPHTVFDGVKLMFKFGYGPVGMLVFCTSIGIPILKLGGMTWFSVSAMSGSRWALQFRTRLYRFIEVVGRWANLDPFTVLIFTPLVQFGPPAHITVGGGGEAFVAVIVILLVATRAFDPRLMWDARG